MRGVAGEKLGDLAVIQPGYAFDSKLFNVDGRGLPVIRIRDVVRGWTSTWYEGPFDERVVVDDGDVLIGMDGEFNVASWRGGRALLNQRVAKIATTSPLLDIGYLKGFLALELKRIEAVTPSVTVKHLSMKTLKGVMVPLPPLDQQRRIAQALESIDAVRSARTHGLALLGQLALSAFDSQFLRGGPGGGLPTAELESLCTRITDGTHQSPEWTDGGVPFLFVSNIVSGEIDWSVERYISDETHRELTRRCPIEIGDVLYSTVGSYGIPAVVRTAKKFAFQRHIAHLKPDRAVLDPDFLAAAMASTAVRRQADRAARGVAQKTLNLADIKAFRIPLPPMAEQLRFAAGMAHLRDTRVAATRHREKLEDLFASVERRAFAGELTLCQ